MTTYAYDYRIAQREPMFIFEINMPPKPQRQTRFTSKPSPLRRIRTYNPSKSQEEMIRWQVAPKAPKEPLKGAIGMELTFYMPIPKGTPKVTRNQMLNGSIRPTTRPDYDNLAYLVTNSLKQLVYHDDSQIVRALIEKYYSDMPRTIIKVWEI